MFIGLGDMTGACRRWVLNPISLYELCGKGTCSKSEIWVLVFVLLLTIMCGSEWSRDSVCSHGKWDFWIDDPVPLVSGCQMCSHSHSHYFWSQGFWPLATDLEYEANLWKVITFMPVPKAGSLENEFKTNMNIPIFKMSSGKENPP